MAETTIEWADYTFNPWIGCQKVSSACDNCYAEARDQRFHKGVHWGPKAARTVTKDWRKVYAWDRKAELACKRAKVFCASLADVFDNHKSIDPEWRQELWRLIRLTQHLDWQLLTKRPQNIRQYLPDDWGDGYPNVWLGTTVENQAEADRRIPHLLDVPAKVRFLSCEPLLGPLDITPCLWPFKSCVDCPCPDPEISRDGIDDCCQEPELQETGLHWVIAGGESGPNARPSHPDWFRSLRDQCVAADVPFFFKQWGEWRPPADNEEFNTLRGRAENPPSFLVDEFGNVHCTKEAAGIKAEPMLRISKRAAGRSLDGVIWDQMPEAS